LDRKGNALDLPDIADHLDFLGTPELLSADMVTALFGSPEIRFQVDRCALHLINSQ
jgi:hypothetical protein